MASKTFGLLCVVLAVAALHHLHDYSVYPSPPLGGDPSIDR